MGSREPVPVPSTSSKQAARPTAGHGEGGEHYLAENTFSFMKVKPVLSLAYLFSLGVYLMQLLLAAMILQQQIDLTAEGTPFDIPFRVNGTTRVAQIMALVFIVFMSKDVVMPMKEISLLWVTNVEKWSGVVGVASSQNDVYWLTWVVRIFLPNILQLIQGGLMLTISFIIVIQTDDVVALFADFAAMYIISDLDEIAFELAKNGYFGSQLINDANMVKIIKVEDHIDKLFNIIPLRPLVLLAVFLITLGSFIQVALNQTNGKYFRQKYPNCAIEAADIVKIGNGFCNGGLFNTFECGFDGGDCALFNVAFPTCKVQNPSEIGDGICQEQYKTDECGFDSLDCCVGDKSLIANGECDPLYNTAICGWDGGDCLVREYSFCRVNQTELIGNGQCDGMPYNTAPCGWDGGDCEISNRNFIVSYPNCIVFDSTFVNNSRCDGGEYMVESCGFDGGDCDEFMEQYPNCTVREPWRVGDGKCDFGEYMVNECGWDGGDCLDEVYPDCQARGKSKAFRNGQCDGMPFNTAACGWDDGDCEVHNRDFIERYPNCVVFDSTFVNNSRCDGGEYMVESCGFDGGDCNEFMEQYPNCTVQEPWRVGDGKCDFGEYMVYECGWDGGDCLDEVYPDCQAKGKYKALFGDGVCDLFDNEERNEDMYEEVANPECGFEGGDCEEFKFFSMPPPSPPSSQPPTFFLE